MIDYNLIYFIIFFMFWIFLLSIAIEKGNKIGFKYIQFIFSMPLIIFIANNSYINSFVFGYVFCFAIGILSLYVLVSDYI